MIKFDNIKVLALDVDGTLTDGIYQISEKESGLGIVTKSFYTRDFYAIERIMRAGILVFIVTQSHDKVMYRQILRIASHSEFWMDKWCTNELILLEGINNKSKAIEDELFDRKLGWNNIAYMGDAENDLECMRKAYYNGCPSDAIESVRDNVSYESYLEGGKGAVHDFCMYILEKRKEK